MIQKWIKFNHSQEIKSNSYHFNKIKILLIGSMLFSKYPVQLKILWKLNRMNENYKIWRLYDDNVTYYSTKLIKYLNKNFFLIECILYKTSTREKIYNRVIILKKSKEYKC